MPLTTYTGTADVTEVIPTELLDNFIRSYDYEPRVADAVAWTRPGRGNVAVRYPRWDQATVPAGTVAETVDGTDVEVALSESTITPGVVRFRMPISDEATVEALRGVPAGALMNQMEALLDRVDSDALSSSTSATQTVGTNTTAFDLDAFSAVVTDLRARRWRTPMGTALVLHDDALDALEQSIRQSGSPWAIKDAERLQESLGSGYQGRMRGLDIFLSGNVAADGGGHSNFATPIGAGISGLGLVMNKRPSVVATRGDDAENRMSTYYHFCAWYGFGITDPAHLVECLSA